MTRTGFATLGAGGLNWDSMPLKLMAGGKAKFWNPADIDFSRERTDWESLTGRPPKVGCRSAAARRNPVPCRQAASSTTMAAVSAREGARASERHRRQRRPPG
jgi:hypothetical protein